MFDEAYIRCKINLANEMGHKPHLLMSPKTAINLSNPPLELSIRDVDLIKSGVCVAKYCGVPVHMDESIDDVKVLVEF